MEIYWDHQTLNVVHIVLKIICLNEGKSESNDNEIYLLHNAKRNH